MFSERILLSMEERHNTLNQLGRDDLDLLLETILYCVYCWIAQLWVVFANKVQLSKDRNYDVYKLELSSELNYNGTCRMLLQSCIY